MDSVAVRSTLYADHFRKHGYEVDYLYWDILPGFESLKKWFPPVFHKLLDRLGGLFLRIRQNRILHRKVKRYDGIVLMKYFPYETVKIIRDSTRAKLLYDFDDPIWLEMYRPMLEKYQQILSCVDCVSVDNEYLYEHAKPFCREIFIFPPPAQFERLPEPEPRDDSEVTIGWIGSGSTSYYLYSLHPVLEELGRRYKNIRLLVLGFPYPVLPFFENIRWEVISSYDEKIMDRARRRIDIGLFPLLPSVNSIGRGLCKPVMYMGAGIPVAATRFGLVSDLIRDGENGMLCGSPEEWIDKLSKLIEDPALRKKLGRSGFETVKQFSIENNFQLLEKHFLSRL
ncbi:MAG: glycosyltransferase family 4 protein [Lentisphaeria bacterium]|nr:glycosyltransferase family 4 protein [Lentisphaeria bacterium]